MSSLTSILMYMAAVANLVCFIIMLFTMLQNQKQMLVIVCIVLSVVYGFGAIVAFVYGWMMFVPWRIKNLMYIWTGAVVALLVFGGLTRV